MLNRAKSESPPSSSMSVVSGSGQAVSTAVHRTSTAPLFNNPPTATTTGSAVGGGVTSRVVCSRAVVSQSASDAALISTLLHSVRTHCSGSTATSGSPVMILKQLIDRHFTDTAAAAAVNKSSVSLTDVDDVDVSDSLHSAAAVNGVLLSNGDVNVTSSSARHQSALDLQGSASDNALRSDAC